MKQDRSRRLRLNGAVLLVVGVVLVGPGCGKKQPKASKTEASKVAVDEKRPWRPDATLLERLDPAVEIGDYALRPPKGFRKTTTNVGKIRVDLWESEFTPDGSRAYLQASVVRDAGSDAEKILAAHLRDLATITEEFQQSNLERGELGGIPFVRVSYSALDRLRGGLYVRGVAYAGTQNGSLLQLTAKEELAKSDSPMMLAAPEAGLLTFRPR